MAAILLAFAVFLFLTILGKAVLDAIDLPFPILRSWLLAPSVGLAVLVLLTLSINQLGLPVKSFASWLTAGLIVFVVLVFWWRRPIFPYRQIGIYFGIGALSLAYTCWPMFLYGFRWVGYMNGDMATYCLDAVRVMHSGFYRLPTIQELNGTDYTQYMWFHFAAGQFRCGADIFLAWLASITGTEPLRISMSALGAANVAQLFAGAALVLSQTRRRSLSIVTSSLVAVSPFFLLGVMAQVLPQVGGIGLLLAFCTVFLRRFHFDGNYLSLLKPALLTGILGAALCVYYPEVIPFAVISGIIFHGYQLVRRRETIGALAVAFAAIAFILLFIARQGVITAVGAILLSFVASIKPWGSHAFDTALDPSIFASLYGLLPYYGPRPDPWTSIAIFVGITLLICSIGISIRSAIRSEPAAFLLLVMLTLDIQLFIARSAFGVFKLAMYSQTVLLVPVAVLILRLPRKAHVWVVALYCVATVGTGLLYVEKSTAVSASTGLTLPNIVKADVRPVAVAGGGPILVNTPNFVGTMVYAAASVGTDVVWADYNGFAGAMGMETMPKQLLPVAAKLGLTKNYVAMAQSLRSHVDGSTGERETILGHSVLRRVSMAKEHFAYFGGMAEDPWHSSNNQGRRQDGQSYFSGESFDKTRNYLALLSSDQGGALGSGHTTSRWPPEGDVYLPGRTFYAVGRRMLFEVIHPTPNVRLRISLTRTLTGLGRTTLPGDAVVEGARPAKLGFVGQGSAAVISEPLQFLERDGQSYFAIDFGTDGNYFPTKKTGFMRLFNIDIPGDDRRVVGFARDIALVSESEYSAIERPRRIMQWPEDLLSSPGTEYSGIYEDGWLGDHAFLVLGKTVAGEKLGIIGEVPALWTLKSAGNVLKVRLNGKAIYDGAVKPGRFTIRHVITEDAPVNRLDFVFQRMERLPLGDERPVAAQLLEVKISPPAASNASSDQSRPE